MTFFVILTDIFEILKDVFSTVFAKSSQMQDVNICI